MSDKESDLYLWLVRHGVSAPSRIAVGLGRERTSTYRLLQEMVDRGYVYATTHHGAKAYGVVDLAKLKWVMDRRVSELTSLADAYSQVSQEYDQLQIQRQAHVPSIKQYEGKYGIEQMYQDMIYMIDREGYIVVSLFASQTFEAMANTNDDLKVLNQALWRSLADRRVVVHHTIGQGMSLMEELVVSKSRTMIDLPTSNNAISLWVVWSSVYLVIAKSIPVGIKIESDELAMMLQFIGGELNKSSSLAKNESLGN